MPACKFDDGAEFAFARRRLQGLLAAAPLAALERSPVGEDGTERIALVPEAGDGEAAAFCDHLRVS
jgi:hypothetical protein